MNGWEKMKHETRSNFNCSPFFFPFLPFSTPTNKFSIYLGAGLGAVHDGVAAVHGEGVLQLRQTLLLGLILRDEEGEKQK